MRRRPDERVRFQLAEKLNIVDPDTILVWPRHLLVRWLAHFALEAERFEKSEGE